ncbi:hypothetical protein KUG85_13575 [Nitratireductor sp. L1-7-SE]|uniref:Uncharacterized protein n=1 Tax=Nitratireductor rhodophyticola TaxID=2854036 RepID=A0ABS7RA76_9HYPH|nr:hypothetical protein [Nitratireductor rhodophyticola]MBY8916370.1 hypothetical protein [Nitratireductor rhodophyticola]MBY8921733.1 hypothetical protein [Nitratireductor rhodophyticola]
MRLAIAGLLVGALAGVAQAAEIESAYTEVNTQENCAAFAAPAGDEPGDWINFVCAGWRGYPVLIYYGDARESIFYGFPPDGDLAPEWESFAGFNSTGSTIEWRIMSDGDRQWPFATIHRWFVDDGESLGDKIEVLVVEKVGQVFGREGCVVGYVVATGNENANEKARRIADGQAFDFACGADQPVIDAGDVPLPEAAGGGGG